jgi:hypothetical protein
MSRGVYKSGERVDRPDHCIHCDWFSLYSQFGTRGYCGKWSKPSDALSSCEKQIKGSESDA